MILFSFPAYDCYSNFCVLLQVLTLRLLRAVLPSWEPGRNKTQQKKLVDDLFYLLGVVLVICSSPFVKPLKPGQLLVTFMWMLN